MAQSLVNSDLFVQGNVSCNSFTPPASCITDAAVIQTANIQATKVIHSFPVRYQTAAGTAVTASTQPLHLVSSSLGATVYAVKATLLVAPTSSDTCTVDVQRSTGGGSFASILTSVITFNSSSTSKTVVSGSLSTTALNQNDLLETIITVSGTSPQGLLLDIFVREAAQ